MRPNISGSVRRSHASRVTAGARRGQHPARRAPIARRRAPCAGGRRRARRPRRPTAGPDAAPRRPRRAARGRGGCRTPRWRRSRARRLARRRRRAIATRRSDRRCRRRDRGRRGGRVPWRRARRCRRPAPPPRLLEVRTPRPAPTSGRSIGFRPRCSYSSRMAMSASTSCGPSASPRRSRTSSAVACERRERADRPSGEEAVVHPPRDVGRQRAVGQRERFGGVAEVVPGGGGGVGSSHATRATRGRRR